MSFKTTDQLKNEGSNLYSANTPLTAAGPETRIETGTIERSNVRPVYEMSRLIEVNRTYQTIAAIIQQTDTLKKSAIDRLADVGQTGA